MTRDGDNLPQSGAVCAETQARPLVNAVLESNRRRQIAQQVLECLQAVQRGELRHYLEPLPVMRLNLAQHAFREIGAIRTANILRSGVYRLTRPGAAEPIATVAIDLAVQLTATTERADRKVVSYLALALERP